MIRTRVVPLPLLVGLLAGAPTVRAVIGAAGPAVTATAGPASPRGGSEWG